MTQMGIIIIKFVASSAMLFAIYMLLMRSRASYRLSRAYLLLLPVLAIAMSLLSFEVYKPEPVVMKIEVPANSQTVDKTAIARDAAVENTQAALNGKSDIVRLFHYIPFLIASVSIILLLRILFFMLKIFVLNVRLKSEQTSRGSFVVRSSLISSPGVFARTIYLPAGLPTDEEVLILRHEESHIRHRHYIDRWTMEVLVSILWFNPFIWMTRKELYGIHEFQADHDVVVSGADMFDYQSLLLRESAIIANPLTNGFHHSTIYQRIIEMKNSKAGTLSRLRKITSGFGLVLLFCLFTFTYGEAETIYHYIYARVEDAPSAQSSETVAEETQDEEIVETPEASEQESEESAMEKNDYHEAAPETKPLIAEDGLRVFTSLPTPTSDVITYKGYYLRRTDDATYLVCVGSCETDDEIVWLGDNENTFIMDADSGTHYMARGSLTPGTWGESFHLRGMKGKGWELTIVFPPIPESVTHIDVHGITYWKHNYYLPVPIKSLLEE